MIDNFVFDVDGTLTPSRRAIDKEFGDWFLNFSYKDTSLQTNKFINIMQHQNLNMPANTYLSEIKFENNLLTLSGYFLTEGGFIKLKDNMHSCWSFTKKEDNMFVAHYV